MGKTPATKVINKPTNMVDFCRINWTKKGLTTNPNTIPKLGTVDSICTPAALTPGKAEYINGKAEEICGAIIKNRETDNRETIKIKRSCGRFVFIGQTSNLDQVLLKESHFFIHCLQGQGVLLITNKDMSFRVLIITIRLSDMTKPFST